MIVIINYNMGNLGSIANMLKKIGAKVKVSSHIEDLIEAEKFILPGIGSFDNGMKNLESLGLVSALNQQILHHKKTILGICLGMQLMTKKSEEGWLPGLGYIDAETVRFKSTVQPLKLKIPHMGWNFVKKVRNNSLFDETHKEIRFYFVHSYHVVCKNVENILTTTCYGYEFTSSFQKGNIFGVQFHPEKSHKFGMDLLRNFIKM